MAEWVDPPHRPLDLPMTIAMCANCGQWLAHEETIKGAMPPEYEPKDLGHEDATIDAFLGGQHPADLGWVCYCPICSIDLSDTPPRHVILFPADKHPPLENLVQKKYHLQELIHIHGRNLELVETRLAQRSLEDLSLKLEHEKERQQKAIQSCTQRLHTVNQELQDKLASL